MGNTMETEHRRLDQLDKLAEKKRKQAESAVEGAIQRIDEEMETLDEGHKPGADSEGRRGADGGDVANATRQPQARRPAEHRQAGH
ncbi:MAG: hypothetical protein U5K43_15475 [Halofilum sp. (in: g-proteobacteria)]|nr:hypothetical protein [Halofilum sp. (in: g-proteobacteria)]